MNDIINLLSNNGLAVTLIILIVFSIFKFFKWLGDRIAPAIEKKINKNIDDEDNLESTCVNNYFNLINDTIQSNEKKMKENTEINLQLLDSMKEINKTNQELSTTNRELSKTNRKLVESFELDIHNIKENVGRMETKLDVMINTKEYRK